MIRAFLNWLAGLITRFNTSPLHGDGTPDPRLPDGPILYKPKIVDGVYIDKFGHKCVCGNCKPPQFIVCDTLAKVKQAQSTLS